MQNPYDGTRNHCYVANSDRALSPASVSDNGYSTAFSFPQMQRIPALLQITQSRRQGGNRRLRGAREHGDHSGDRTGMGAARRSNGARDPRSCLQSDPRLRNGLDAGN